MAEKFSERAFREMVFSYEKNPVQTLTSVENNGVLAAFGKVERMLDNCDEVTRSVLHEMMCASQHAENMEQDEEQKQFERGRGVGYHLAQHCFVSGA